MNSEETLAEQLHKSFKTINDIEDIISDAFEKYEPDIYKILVFHIASDSYDNSIEIYFDISLPYPYEPCKEIRKIIYDLGFSSIYWNFLKDTMDVVKFGKAWKDSPDEIRNYEPRHNRYAHWTTSIYGYVDERFNQSEWESKYNFRN